MLLFDTLRIVIAGGQRERLALQALLETIGVSHIATAENAPEARVLMRQSRANLLITGDDAGALVLVRALRASAAAAERDIPILLVTARSDSFLDAARGAGVDEILAKPVSVNVLQLRLAQMLLKPRALMPLVARPLVQETFP